MGLQEMLAWVPPGSQDEALLRQIDMDAAARARRHHHGRQRPLGGASATCRASRATAPASPSVRDVVETSARLGIEVLTLYAFSVENWKRPAAEVGTLMTAAEALPADGARHAACSNDIRFQVIGRTDDLARGRPGGTRRGRSSGRPATRGMLFNIALNYGGRAEIVDAARRAIAGGLRPDDLDEESFAGCSTRPGSPIPTC